MTSKDSFYFLKNFVKNTSNQTEKFLNSSSNSSKRLFKSFEEWYKLDETPGFFSKIEKKIK